MSQGQVDKNLQGSRFLEKAERLLKWLEVWLEELREYGSQSQRDNIERTFFAALAAVASTHEALLSAAKCWNRLEWRRELQTARENDRLLRYFNKARDAEVHTDVIKWLPGFHASIAWRVVDEKKANAICGMFKNPIHLDHFDNAILRYIFDAGSMADLREKMEVSPRPLPERVAAAGVEVKFALHGLILKEFNLSGKGDRSKTNRILLPEEDDAADLCLDYGVAAEQLLSH